MLQALNLRARKAKAARRPQLARDMKPGIIIENVAQTRRRLAETTLLATASLAPGSSSIVDEGPTNTGSGSQVVKHACQNVRTDDYLTLNTSRCNTTIPNPYPSLLPQKLLWGSKGIFLLAQKKVIDFKNIFEVNYSIVNEHKSFIIVIVFKIIIFRDKSNMDNIRCTNIYEEV
jgi:hypothetical protein